MEKAQREYFLRQQLKAIQKELGEEKTCKRLTRNTSRSSTRRCPPRRPRKRSGARCRAWTPPAAGTGARADQDLPRLAGVAALAAVHRRPDRHRPARKVLDEDHYGLEKVKERILEYLAVRKLPQERGGGGGGKDEPPARQGGHAGRDPVLGGAAGRGQDLAGAVDRARPGAQVRAHLAGRGPRRGRDPRPSPHLRRRLAGAHHAGHRARQPSNPVFMLDEIDKVGMDWRGDPSRAAGSVGPGPELRFPGPLSGRGL